MTVSGGNSAMRRNLPVQIISHFNLTHVTSPIWGLPPTCKQALSDGNIISYARSDHVYVFWRLGLRKGDRK